MTSDLLSAARSVIEAAEKAKLSNNTVVAYADHDQREFAKLALTESPRLAQAVMDLSAALTKINGIRNSIIGTQTMNWSEHIYPLVAALNEAGFEGMGYPAAREYFGALIEQRNRAEQARDEAVREVSELREALFCTTTDLDALKTDAKFVVDIFCGDGDEADRKFTMNALITRIDALTGGKRT